MGFDQRGTGRDALQCPALQKAMGASDLTPPPAAAVRGCARALGDQRGFYTTADTVEDLEALRIALRAKRMALDGVSYGTYVAQRYALAHPDRVSGLVLDSVVPAEGVSLLSPVSIKATRRVLGKDATEALAKVVREQHNGPQMLDMLTGLSVGAPRGNGAANAIQAAADGNPGPLDGLHAGVLDVMQGWTAGDAQPGPARQHAVRGLARAVGRRVGAAGGPQSRRSRTRPRSSPTTICTRTTARPRPATASPARAWTGRRWTCLRRRARATCPTSRPCCSPATATSRPRSSGRRRRRSARPAAA